MFWQGIDPIAAIRVLGESIFHVHAKDTQIYAANLPKTGVLDTKKYTDERNRSWIFRTVGYGHAYGWWKEFISTLRMYGYDYVLSIEHEDSLMSPEEGLAKGARVPQRNRDRREAGRSLVGLNDAIADRAAVARSEDSLRNLAGVMPECFLNRAQKWL